MRQFGVLPGALLGMCFAGGAFAAEPTSVPTAITAVTVYADRAQVTRTGGIELSSQGSRFVVTRLPGWIDAESVRATLVPATAGQILDVTVETSFLAEASEEGVRNAEAAVRTISDDVGAIADEEKVLADEIARLESLRAFSIDKLPKELATRDVSVKNLGDTLSFISETLRRDRKALRELANKRRDLEPELAARVKKRDELQSRTQLQQSTVVLDLTGSGRATLVLTYLTPGAAWEPAGELRVSKGGESVALTQYATVVQTTGEDWDRAALSFSTQRPGEILDVPEVQALLLGSGGSGLTEILGRMGQSFDKAQTNYLEQNEFFAKTRANWNDNIENQRQIQTRAADNFAKIAGRGTTAHFTALTERTVRADGRAVRVPIASAEFAAKLFLVGVPESSPNVVRTAELTNTGARPILPGRVALFEDGAFVGTSELGFVAPGETFTTFLGVNERLKLGRTLDRKRSSLERGSRRTKLVISMVVTAENLADHSVDVQLADRVPVAQSDDIEIGDVEMPEGARADAAGVIRWTAVIGPKQKASWRIEYTLEYANDLVERTREQRKSMAPSPARSLYDDIENMEKSF